MSDVPQLQRLRDHQYRDLYANASLTTLGPFDVTLIFQKIGDIGGGQLATVDLASVTMSPQHFKGFVRSLNETLVAYEKTFGELKIPDADTRPLKSAEEIVEMLRAARPSPPSSNEPPQPSPQSHGASLRKARRP